eukprot:6104734-Amphidinium_carterae.1
MRQLMEQRAKPKADQHAPEPLATDPKIRAALKRRNASKLQWKKHVKPLAKQEVPHELLERLG